MVVLTETLQAGQAKPHSEYVSIPSVTNFSMMERSGVILLVGGGFVSPEMMPHREIKVSLSWKQAGNRAVVAIYVVLTQLLFLQIRQLCTQATEPNTGPAKEKADIQTGHSVHLIEGDSFCCRYPSVYIRMEYKYLLTPCPFYEIYPHSCSPNLFVLISDLAPSKSQVAVSSTV